MKGLIGIFLMANTVALICCTPKATNEPSTTDTVGTEVSKENLTISKPLSTSQLTTKSLANDQTNLAQDKTISILKDSITNITKALYPTVQAYGVLQKTLKSTQDSVAVYKQILDGAIFQSVNGVTTINYFIAMRDYMIKNGMIKP